MTPELQAKLKEIALKHAKEMASELLAEVAFPALKAAVEKSETKVDDAILLTLEAPLKAMIVEMINKIEA